MGTMLRGKEKKLLFVGMNYFLKNRPIFEVRQIQLGQVNLPLRGMDTLGRYSAILLNGDICEFLLTFLCMGPL